MNRLTRDEILHAALDDADVPSLDERDRPGRVIRPQALSLRWLQHGIDWFHQQWPWGALVTTAALTLDTTGVVSLPADFVLDFKNGLLVTYNDAKYQVFRRGQPEYVQWQTLNEGPGLPRYYLITKPVSGSQVPRLTVFPTPDKSYSATLHYYQLPNIMQDGAKIPQFPSDLVLIEYVKTKALEWCGRAEMGTAYNYAKIILGDLQKSGFGLETERADIPLDPTVFRVRHADSGDSWMGATVVP